MRKFVAPVIIGYMLSVLLGTSGLVTIVAVYAMWVLLVRRKPSRIYR